MALPTGISVQGNFPGDRLYTLNALVEQLGLMELHINDGSWKACSCNPEKHLPIIAGLASEGCRFAESQGERAFMQDVRDRARDYRGKIKNLELRTQGDMDGMADWGRGVRHGVEARDWRSTPVAAGREHLESNPWGDLREKELKGRNVDNRGSDKNMIPGKEVLGINGTQFIAKGAQVGLDALDGYLGKADAPIHLKPSVWVNIGGGILLQGLAMWKKVKRPLDLYLVVAGSNMLTKSVDYAQEALMAAPVARVSMQAASRLAMPQYMVTTNKTVQVNPVLGTAPMSRYAITG